MAPPINLVTGDHRAGWTTSRPVNEYALIRTQFVRSTRSAHGETPSVANRDTSVGSSTTDAAPRITTLHPIRRSASKASTSKATGTSFSAAISLLPDAVRKITEL